MGEGIAELLAAIIYGEPRLTLDLDLVPYPRSRGPYLGVGQRGPDPDPPRPAAQGWPPRPLSNSLGVLVAHIRALTNTSYRSITRIVPSPLLSTKICPAVVRSNRKSAR